MLFLHLALLLSVCSPNCQEAYAEEERLLSPEMVEKVDEAVDQAVAWLLSRQQKNGSFRITGIRDELFAEDLLGQTALSTLALLSCDIPRQDSAIQNALHFILSEPSLTTYQAGLILMVLDAKGAPQWEKKSLLGMSEASKKNYRFPRLLTEEERNRIQTDADLLSESWGSGYWFYGRKTGSQGDISNTQFAILGLRAASRSGAHVSEEIFGGLLREMVRTQEPVGPTMEYETYVRRRPWDPLYLIGVMAQARGWGYFNYQRRSDGPRTRSFPDTTGSRTCIGIASLAICRDELLRRDTDSARNLLRLTEPEVDRAIRDGLAWMDKYFSVERNPGTDHFGKLAKMPMNSIWYYYYLYALERVGILLPTRHVGKHDWYQEGAEEIVKRQSKKGYWEESNPLVDTCFALLFLRRATAPSIYTYSGIR